MSETEYSLGRHCGITFAGIKPASLLGVKTGERRAFRRVAKGFRRKGFVFRAVRENGDRTVVYIYHAARMEQILFSAEVRDFLSAFGYRYDTLSEAVEELAARMQAGAFPHEVGVFLGYPLEDVRGFIADPQGGSPGYWRVYGGEAEKAKLFARYKRCSARICSMMDGGKSLSAIFNLE